MKRNWIDAHVHLADPRLKDEVGGVIARAQSRGIQQFVQGGVGPEDWALQSDLANKYPGIFLCFGLHPYWVSGHSEDECEIALDQLARELPRAVALGELGLDFRPEIVHDRHAHQIQFFEKQLELASFAKKPIVLHIVKAQDEALKVFEHFGVPEKKGFVHSFNSGPLQAESYLKLGLLLSVGGPLCRPNNKALRQAVEMIPLTSLLIETDSPDQPPPSHQGKKNEPITLLEVASVVAEIKKMTPEEVLDMTSQNLRKQLHVDTYNGNNSDHFES